MFNNVNTNISFSNETNVYVGCKFIFVSFLLNKQNYLFYCYKLIP